MRYAALGGAVWGVVAYALLWGLTPVVIHRAFVVTPHGTVLLLPARLVLWGVHVVEDAFASQPFAFSSNHGWIGVLSTLAGAGLALGGYALSRAAVRLARR